MTLCLTCFCDNAPLQVRVSKATHLSECGFLPGLLELLLQVGPDAHLDVHDAGTGELTQQVLQLHVAWINVKELTVLLQHNRRVTR